MILRHIELTPEGSIIDHTVIFKMKPSAIGYLAPEKD